MCLVRDVSVRQEVFFSENIFFFFFFYFFTIIRFLFEYSVTEMVYACYLVFLFIMYILILCIFVVYWSTHKTNTEMTQQKFHPSP